MTRTVWLALLGMLATVTVVSTPAAAQQPQKPNIIVIMGDDIGWANIGVYNQGMMAGRAPNLDKLAAEGMITPRRVVRRGAQTSSPANFQSARG